MELRSNLFLLFILFSFLSSGCERKRHYHVVIELTYPDRTIEMASLGPDNQMLISFDDRYYILRAKTIHGESADIEVVESTCVYDSANAEYNILKLDSQLDYCALHKKHILGGKNGGIEVELVSIPDEEKTLESEYCHGYAECCVATCYSTICCTGGLNCQNDPCNCKALQACPNQKSIPAIRDFAKLFSREKINVKVKAF